jgi:Fe2+ or Zn2+ uptake regulation protein
MAYTARERVLDAVESIEGRPGGLVAVVDVVRGVSPPLRLSTVHRELFALNREGFIELRAESGVSSLDVREAELVPWVELPFYGRQPVTFVRRLA